jgi:hypothetical protein
MKTRKFIPSLLLVLVLLMTGAVTCCSEPLTPTQETTSSVEQSTETQEILDFVTNLRLISDADNKLALDYNDFAIRLIDIYTQMQTLQGSEAEVLQSQLLEEVKEFIERAGDIYLEIGKLYAPQSCRTVQYKWKEAYECRIQSLECLLSCLSTGDQDAYSESDVFLTKGNQVITEAKYELNDIATAHGIEMQWK